MVVTASNAHAKVDFKDLSRHRVGGRIVSAGIELEGGMNQIDLARLEDHVLAMGLSENYQRGRENYLDVRGKSLGNLELRLWSDNFSAVTDFLRYAYDECGFATNAKCGMHVHLKFEDMPSTVSFFSSKKVQERFREEYKRKFGDDPKYLARLSNIQCRGDNIFMGVEGFVGHTSPNGVGYCEKSTINLAAYRKLGTIEFRILPNQSTGKEAVESLNWLVSTVEKVYGSFGGIASDAVVTPQRVDADKRMWLIRHTARS